MADAARPTYRLSLFITGGSPRSVRAIVNVRQVCEQHLHGCYVLEIFDIGARPELARSHQLLASPTLIKHEPLPLRRMVGDMSDTAQLLRGLGLSAAPRSEPEP